MCQSSGTWALAPPPIFSNFSSVVRLSNILFREKIDGGLSFLNGNIGAVNDNSRRLIQGVNLSLASSSRFFLAWLLKARGTAPAIWP